MSDNNSILGISTQDSILNDIFKNDIQYTHITGNVNLCVNRCGQEIDDCEDIHFMNMVNNGKVMTLNPNPEKSGNGKCMLKRAYDDDSNDANGFTSYKFEKMFVMTPSFHKIDSVVYDAEFGFIFSRFDKYNKKKYMVLCVLVNNALDTRQETLNESNDLLFYKLTNELFGINEKVPALFSKKEINYPPNPILLSNFFPIIGQRSFYEYSYQQTNDVTYRIFQKPMVISSTALQNLREKLTPNKLFEQMKGALQSYENPKRGLLLFFKEDVQKKSETFENTSHNNSENNTENMNEKTIEKFSDGEDDGDVDILNTISDMTNSTTTQPTSLDIPEKSTMTTQSVNFNTSKKGTVTTGLTDDGNGDPRTCTTDVTTNLQDTSLDDPEKPVIPQSGDPGGINIIFQVYLTAIILIVFNIIIQYSLSYLTNKQDESYTMTQEIFNDTMKKNNRIIDGYFITKIFNYVFIFLQIILYIFLIVKGMTLSFSVDSIKNNKNLLNLMRTIGAFLFLSIISFIIQYGIRMCLSDFKNISYIDSFFNIDSIIMYIQNKKNSLSGVQEECGDNTDYKLSMSGGGSGNLWKEFMDNFSYIGKSFTENTKKITFIIIAIGLFCLTFGFPLMEICRKIIDDKDSIMYLGYKHILNLFIVSFSLLYCIFIFWIIVVLGFNSDVRSFLLQSKYGSGLLIVFFMLLLTFSIILGINAKKKNSVKIDVMVLVVLVIGFSILLIMLFIYNKSKFIQNKKTEEILLQQSIEQQARQQALSRVAQATTNTSTLSSTLGTISGPSSSSPTLTNQAIQQFQQRYIPSP